MDVKSTKIFTRLVATFSFCEVINNFFQTRRGLDNHEWRCLVTKRFAFSYFPEKIKPMSP